jgi:hypothetical protein
MATNCYVIIRKLPLLHLFSTNFWYSHTGGKFKHTGVIHHLADGKWDMWVVKVLKACTT